MYKLLIGLLLMPLLFSCSGQIELLDEPVVFSGKLILEDGSPVNDVLLTLQPLEHGHPVLLEVDSSGAFRGAGVPGECVYYVGAPSKPRPSSSAPLKKVPADFQQANLERTVRIGDSPELELRSR